MRLSTRLAAGRAVRSIAPAAFVFPIAAVVGLAGAHDEDWRKLVSRMPAVEGPIWTQASEATRRGVSLDDIAGSSGGFDAQGISLLAQIPLNQFPGNNPSGNDCWGYTSPSGREYAIMGLERGYGYVEITDPINPVVIDYVSGPSSFWHDVKVIGTYAYGVSEGGSGIQVMDLSDIDNGNVTLVRNWQASGHSTTHNIISNPEAGTLYLCGANIGNGGLINLDLSDPTRPAVDGGWTNMYVHDAQVVTWQSGALAGREIAFVASGFNGGQSQTGLRVVDMTNPNNPQTLDTLLYPAAGYSHQVWLSEDQNYLYLNDELDEDFGLVSQTTTRIIDVSNPNNVSLVGTFSSGRPSIDHNLYTLGRYIFQANYRSGLRVFDAINPTNPVEIAYFDTFPGSDAPEFNGAWSVYPYFQSGTVIVSDIERGLFVLSVDVLDPDRLDLSAFTTPPTELNPAGGETLDVFVEPVGTQIVPGSVNLVVESGAGTQTVPGLAIGSDLYRFEFPPVPCGSPVSYYVTADSTSSETFNLPAAGASAPFNAFVLSGITPTFVDNFQTNQGWTVSGDANDGQWTRGVPVNNGRGDPATDSDGSGACYLTDNSSANGGNSDVDGGSTILTSPVFDLAGGGRILFDYWFNDIANGPVQGPDGLTVELSVNGGATWDELFRQTIPSGAWRSEVFDLPASAASSTMRIRFIATDDVPANVIEAGVDAFRAEKTECVDPEPDCLADLAPAGAPDGVLDIDDVLAFLDAFATQDPAADVAAPTGVFDIDDVLNFLDAFAAGCP